MDNSDNKSVIEFALIQFHQLNLDPSGSPRAFHGDIFTHYIF